MRPGATLPRVRRRLRMLLALFIVAMLSGCSGLSTRERQQVEQLVTQARSSWIDCNQPDACASPSPLRDLGTQAFADSSSTQPRHYALILDYGQDAMLARLDLMRGAQHSIDLQTYIFDEDDAGKLFIEEMLAAARRGVQVRVLIDQLSAMKHVQTLAALAGAHRNLQIRIYNPVLNRARINYPMYALAAACCWRRLNQRMHSKLLLVDDMVGITGGRNYQDDYYDWSADYNFRDRDVLVAGPSAHDMQRNFQAFWDNRRSVPIEQLADVGKFLLRQGVPGLEKPVYERPDRVEVISRNVGDTALVRDRLAASALPVADVQFIADLPQKHRRDRERAELANHASPELHTLIESARKDILLQTPYLVLSSTAQDMFRKLHQRPDGPLVRISTNSLASIDSFITYAMTYKYRRRYLRELGFQLYEFKPFPEEVPIDLDTLGAVNIAWDENGQPLLGPDGGEASDANARAPGHAKPGPRALTREYAALRYAGFKVNERVPLQRSGMRIGLHAKSMVIDDRVGVVGTHNFDPRSDHYNTESAVVIDDPAFAQALAHSILRDMAPQNSWVIARRAKPPVLSGLNYSLGKVSEQLPIFDLWPGTYATSYEFQPGPDCPMPLPPTDPGFRNCYAAVGNFPEVAIGFKRLLTRIFTAFGAGLTPIL